ncbi:hypothetical protein KA005_73160 [bacterium]|nr:hypothetical protein [bacterium]
MGRFEEYDFEKMKIFGDPTITITKNGAINFNAGLMHKYIKNRDYMILHYDKLDKRVGFEFIMEKLPKAFRIRKAKNNNFGTIAGRSFLKYYDIPYNVTSKFLVVRDKETKFLVIDLKKLTQGKLPKTEIDEKEVDAF